MTPPFSGRISETPKNWVLGHDALAKKKKWWSSSSGVYTNTTKFSKEKKNPKSKIQKKPHEAHEVRNMYAKDQFEEYQIVQN